MSIETLQGQGQLILPDATRVVEYSIRVFQDYSPGAPPLSSVKALGEATLRPALDRVRAGKDDLLLMAAGPAEGTSMLLGQLRLAIAKKENLADPQAFEFLWVTEFPLLEWHEEDKRWYSVNHPFTAPMEDDLPLLETDPGRDPPTSKWCARVTA